ncbi:MAG: hypothetical protein DMF67_12065 [Acidobacteria bacterium]|nr:MAG: hypothetical protein DMF66_05665 [Acidobacteriota bacterium]PYS82657.1 MAG: hypothetical protein DMF67_12065 [Acidobacteriota bacterium]
MKEYRGTKQDKACDDPFERIEFLVKKNPRAWQSVGAVVGLAGGILAPALGSLLAVVRWFISVQRAGPYLSSLSIVLFALTIPLLALGAHCLDLLEAKTAPPAPPVEPLSAGVASVIRYGPWTRKKNRKGGTRRALIDDLGMLARLYVARFIVWRGLRDRRKLGKGTDDDRRLDSRRRQSGHHLRLAHTASVPRRGEKARQHFYNDARQ